LNLLAIETATEACSVALSATGRVHARHLEVPRAHGDRLLEMIEEVLEAGDIGRERLDALAFGRGPGGFTSLRIGTGVVQGIGYALDLPVIPVSTLATLAQGARRVAGAERVIAAIDARMGEIYCGVFELDPDGLMRPAGPEVVMPPSQFRCPAGGGWHGAGTGWDTYGEELTTTCGTALATARRHNLPEARDMIPLALAAWERGESVPPDRAVPIYLRDRVAEKKSW